jgi:hypothetical protein
MPSYSGVWTLTAVYQAVGAGNWTNPSYWIATLSGSGYDYGQGIAVDSSGNVFVAGIITGNNFLLTKYNKFGAIQWQRKLGTCSDNGRGNMLAIDASGNCHVVGAIDDGGTKSVIVFKYDTSGVLQWQKKLSSASEDYGYGVAVDSLSNVYVVGTTDVAATWNSALIVKYNSSGAVQWQRGLDAATYTNEIAYGVALDSSANVYLVGITNSSGGFGNSDILVAKYNTSGVIQWQKRLGGAAADNGKSVAVDGSGNVYVVGDSGGGFGGFDVVIAKYDTSGVLQWQRRIGAAGGEVVYGVAVDALGNSYLTGDTGGDLLIAKYDTSGAIQWQRSLTSSGSDAGYAIAVDADGAMYVTGFTTVTDPSSEYDVIIAKLPADGSRTGTYGSWTYAASSLSTATATLSDATATLTDASRSLTGADSALTPTTPTLTSTVTPI